MIIAMYFIHLCCNHVHNIYQYSNHICISIGSQSYFGYAYYLYVDSKWCRMLFPFSKCMHLFIFIYQFPIELCMTSLYVYDELPTAYLQYVNISFPLYYHVQYAYLVVVFAITLLYITPSCSVFCPEYTPMIWTFIFNTLYIYPLFFIYPE